MSASERRAVGEREFCDCATCVSIGPETWRMVRAPLRPTTVYETVSFLDMTERDVPLAAWLRATVIWTLLFGWGDP